MEELEPDNLNSVEKEMLRFFKCDHLPDPLRNVSAPFLHTAEFMIDTLPHSRERTAGLRKLLEAKDCAVRAHVSATPEGTKFGGYKG